MGIAGPVEQNSQVMSELNTLPENKII